MRYHALACDYDGTLAVHGRVAPPTLEALERLAASGRHLLLVTGRKLDDLLAVFPQALMFDRIVAENGALLYTPSRREKRALGERPPREFVERLRAAGVEPVDTGEVIVATWVPHETTIVGIIREMALELQVIFNKGSVMVLPSGVNKASGLTAALQDLALSPHNVVGVGDAENDHAFLALCECAVAVADALPAIRERSDWTTDGGAGQGVVELIDALLEDDLLRLDPRLIRHAIPLGTDGDGTELHLRPYGSTVLLAGTSGSGKSTLAAGLVERLAERAYQFCILDPEGDYDTLPGAIVLGGPRGRPQLEEALEILERPRSNVVVNMLGVPLADRPGLFEQLFPRLVELRTRTGRPHWIVIDETHHLLPAAWNTEGLLPQQLLGILMITVHPDRVSRPLLSAVDTLLVVGGIPRETLQRFCESVDCGPPPVTPAQDLEPGEAVIWFRHGEEPPHRLRYLPPRAERRRHLRKYAVGELGPDKSFFFRGPEGRLNLQAQNVTLFVQLARGVDAETWEFHRKRGDYSRWFREAIKDEGLADEVQSLESDGELSAESSRERILEAVEARYTAPE